MPWLYRPARIPSVLARRGPGRPGWRGSSVPPRLDSRRPVPTVGVPGAPDQLRPSTHPVACLLQGLIRRSGQDALDCRLEALGALVTVQSEFVATVETFADVLGQIPRR